MKNIDLLGLFYTINPKIKYVSIYKMNLKQSFLSLVLYYFLETKGNGWWFDVDMEIKTLRKVYSKYEAKKYS